jgi:hypothetical protein
MRSMVEGARADGEILWRQEKRRLKRPSHRTSCGPPSPLSRGGIYLPPRGSGRSAR